MQRGFRLEPPQATVAVSVLNCALGDGVRRLVIANPVGHLILQVELPLFQRLLFEFLFARDLILGRELVQTALTSLVLVRPLAKLGIFIGKNALNVSGTIRHRLSSFEVPIREKILALCLPGGGGFESSRK
jgi:hypothetical protein